MKKTPARLRAEATAKRAVAARAGWKARVAREIAAKAEAAKGAYREARRSGASKGAAKQAATDAAAAVKLPPKQTKGKPAPSRSGGGFGGKGGDSGGGGGGRTVPSREQYDAIDYDLDNLNDGWEPDEEGDY